MGVLTGDPGRGTTNQEWCARIPRWLCRTCTLERLIALTRRPATYLPVLVLGIAVQHHQPVTAQQLTGLFGCTTTDNHERWQLKQRPKPQSLSTAKVISLDTILGWAIPAGHTDHDEGAIPPREPKLYRVSGFVRLIKQDPVDCDFHLELADSGDPQAKRVIVEIPATQKALQQKAAGMFNLSGSAHKHSYNGPNARAVTVTGYAFIDLSHQCRTLPTAGCNHGTARVQTIWEIHPVFTLEWVAP